MVITLFSTSHAPDESNYTPTWPSRQPLQSHTCAVSHDSGHASLYNASSQLISSIKGTFVDSPNARKVTQVRMVILFQLNSMEIQQLNHQHYSAAQD